MPLIPLEMCFSHFRCTYHVVVVTFWSTSRDPFLWVSWVALLRCFGVLNPFNPFTFHGYFDCWQKPAWDEAALPCVCKPAFPQLAGSSCSAHSQSHLVKTQRRISRTSWGKNGEINVCKERENVFREINDSVSLTIRHLKILNFHCMVYILSTPWTVYLWLNCWHSNYIWSLRPEEVTEGSMEIEKNREQSTGLFSLTMHVHLLAKLCHLDPRNIFYSDFCRVVYCMRAMGKHSHDSLFQWKPSLTTKWTVLIL